MQVFRAYFKVMRAAAGGIAIYLGIFVGMAFMFSIWAPSSTVADFRETRTPVAVINRDGDAVLAQGLADYIADCFRLVDYPDDPEKLQDALYYRNVEYVAIIPAGFSEQFMAGTDGAEGAAGAIIDKVIVPGSTSSYYVDLRIDKFLNTARFHKDYGVGVAAQEPTATGAHADTQARIVEAVRADLAGQTEVTVRPGAAVATNLTKGYNYYFAYFSYSLLAMAMMGISSIMMAFNRTDLRMRNTCAPLPQHTVNLAIASGHAVFALGCWALLMLFGAAVYGKSLLSSGLFGLYIVNSLAFTVVAVAIGFATGSFVKTESSQSGAVNVIALGMSFLCGVFVPQYVLSRSVLAFAKFLPTYWYIRANDAIGSLPGSASNNLQPIYTSILIQLGFAAAIFSVTMLLSKERRLAQL